MRLLTVTTLALLFFPAMLPFASHAQKCEVKMKSLEGKYTGECAAGKAHGQGLAEGEDKYEGEFINGYPDGVGKYTWADGHEYQGKWKKGNQDGQGTMRYPRPGGDSLVSGFWKKNRYMGLYEKPWEIIATSTRVGRIDPRNNNKSGNSIIFTLHQISDLSTPSSKGILPEIQAESVITGTYRNRTRQALSNETIFRYKEVVFPFRILLTFSGNETAEILFNEPGNYDVMINLAQ